MKRDAKETVLKGIEGEVHIRRMAHGYPSITADSEADRYYGLGYAHGRDRQMQMWLLKLIGQGRASECLRADDLLIEMDRTMRWIGLAGDAADETRHLSDDARAILDAYCTGVNDAALATGRPFEFKLVGYRPDAWTSADALLVAKMIGYVGFSQSQADAERLIIQMLQNGVDADRVKELFPAIEEEISDELVRLIRRVSLAETVIPSTIPWGLLPGFSASNNWAVSPSKTASGKAMLCGDPHLGLQLPCYWYLAVLSGRDGYLMGATMPGLPAVVIGRSPKLAWSTTYGTSDVCDYFIEEVKDGKYRRGDAWVPFVLREEVLHPKKRDPITVRVHETVHGLLEGEPEEDGYYLSYAWTGKQQKGTAAQSLESILRVPKAATVEEARDCFSGLTFGAFNWVFADRQGDIGYQLGGLFPDRPAGTSGLLPYPGWDTSQDWAGMVDSRLHPQVGNPEAGFIVTANQDLNHLGRIAPMKLPMSTYRADRVGDLLRDRDALNVEDMKRIHYDRYSLQAECFMTIIRPMLPDSGNGDILRAWDMRYEADSLGATLFERIYRELVLLVFGDGGVGREAMAHLMDETHLFAMLHGNLDRILLSESPAWFGEQSREALYRTAIERGLNGKAVPHGKTRGMRVQHVFFGGKLPGFLGFDYAIEHIGSRATIPQAQVFRMGDRSLSFAATLRMICDLGSDELHVNIAGGASDRRFSRYYTSGMRAWENGEYEVLRPRV